MNDIQFSIITIVYNESDTIDSTLKSIISQSYNAFEYIVIDGKSTDGTTEIIKKYSNSIDYFISENDKGIYDAMNKGLSFCNGEYVIFMNGGDCFANEYVLEKIYSILKSSNNLYDFIYGDSIVKMKENKTYPKRARNHRYFWYGMFANHQAMVYSLSIIRNYNLRYDLKYKISADYKFTLEFLQKSKSICYIPTAICLFSMDGISNQQKQLGLVEAQNARSEVLRYTKLQNSFIGVILYLSRFLSDNMGNVYKYLRYK